MEQNGPKMTHNEMVDFMVDFCKRHYDNIKELSNHRIMLYLGILCYTLDDYKQLADFIDESPFNATSVYDMILNWKQLKEEQEQRRAEREQREK